LSRRFPRIIAAVGALRCENAVMDGEIVCLDLDGKPCFEDLQNFSPKRNQFLFYYGFDLMWLGGHDLRGLLVSERKQRLAELLMGCPPALRLSEALDANPDDLVAFARAHKLEGVIAKRRDSRYEAGKRSGAWQKFKMYQEADFLVGGFLPSPDGIVALAVGFRDAEQFRYAARLEVYWSAQRKADLRKRLLPLLRPGCPFEKVPTKRSGDTWSAGITADEQEQFVWVKPKVHVGVRFLEWTKAGVLRQARLEPESH
jgi:bifunctional non-homologous end joining protein LigD